jgi:hypothetical protein
MKMMGIALPKQGQKEELLRKIPNSSMSKERNKNE